MSLRLKVLYAGARLYWRIFKPRTMGVKLMLIRDERVLLVKHSYESGWHLPGGGMKKKETVETAVRREAREELGASLGEMSLMGIFSNIKEDKSDHVIVFVCTDFTLSDKKDAEIEAYDFFPFTQLPPETTSGVRNRVAEYEAGDERPLVKEW